MTNTSAVKDAVKVIIDELNGGNRHEVAGAILEAVSTSHRTLQQDFWSSILSAQLRYADNAHDLRNEAAVQLAQAVRDLARERNLDMYGLPRY